MHEAMTQPEDMTGRAALYRKLHAVMKDVQYIQKDAQNDFHRYRYASEAAIKGALHKAFVEHGIIFMMGVLDVQEREGGETKSGKRQWITRAMMQYEFTDIDTGYSITNTFAGQGIDGEDKGLYKAITGALKYVLTTSFLIETGDDPESETDQGQRRKAAMTKTIEKAASGVGTNEKGGHDIGKMIEALETEKARLIELLGEIAGTTVYYDTLTQYGVRHANDKKLMANREKAVALWKALKEKVIAAADMLPSDAAEPPAGY
jgi:hypothetical protein